MPGATRCVDLFWPRKPRRLRLDQSTTTPRLSRSAIPSSLTKPTCAFSRQSAGATRPRRPLRTTSRAALHIPDCLPSRRAAVHCAGPPREQTSARRKNATSERVLLFTPVCPGPHGNLTLGVDHFFFSDTVETWIWTTQGLPWRGRRYYMRAASRKAPAEIASGVCHGAISSHRIRTTLRRSGSGGYGPAMQALSQTEADAERFNELLKGAGKASAAGRDGEAYGLAAKAAELAKAHSACRPL